MACGERETVTIRYWGVCWRWIFPYPCRKTRQVQKYRYDFRPWRTDSLGHHSDVATKLLRRPAIRLVLLDVEPIRDRNGPWVDTLWVTTQTATWGVW